MKDLEDNDPHLQTRKRKQIDDRRLRVRLGRRARTYVRGIRIVVVWLRSSHAHRSGASRTVQSSR
jgi:hypothetical protein